MRYFLWDKTCPGVKGHGEFDGKGLVGQGVGLDLPRAKNSNFPLYFVWEIMVHMHVHHYFPYKI